MCFTYAFMTRFDIRIPGFRRIRYGYLNDQRITDMSYVLFAVLMHVHGSQLLEKDDQKYQRIVSIIKRLLAKNTDIVGVTEKLWTITIVKKNQKNAFVLPTGNIFIFTGLIDFCEHDDELGIILGHEI